MADRPLSLAIDARNFDDPRGLGRYFRRLGALFVARDDVAVTFVVPHFFPERSRAAIRAFAGSGRFALARRIPRRADVSWHPWNGIFARTSRPAIVTIADVAPLRFPASDERRRRHEASPFHDAARRASGIATISQSSAADIETLLHVPRNRIHVTYLGVDPVFTPRTNPWLTESRAYLLFVGNTRETRKNFATLYAAYERAWPGEDGPELRVCGEADARFPRARFSAAVDDEALAELYRGALATCVPALYEGFGMPLLESMACGTPVLAADASSLPEVAGQAAWLLPPHDVESWSSALRTIATDATRRAGLRAAGLLRAEDFSWQRCAEETLAVIRRAAAQAD